MRPVLVAVAHGTRDPAGPNVIARLLADVRRRLPDVDVVTAWAELVEPGLGDVMSAMTRPSVVVPLFLSSGYHMMSDVPAGVALSEASVHVTPPLGPDPLLARAMVARLRAVGARFGDGVVLAAAGSTEAAGLRDVEQAASLLRAQWGPRVTHACISASGPGIQNAAEHLRANGATTVRIAPYLLAPGRFSRQVAELAAAAGVTSVAPVLGSHPLLAELVVGRYRQGARAFGLAVHAAA